MKILLIHQYFLEMDDPGGSRWNEMSSMWSKEGHEITVICGMVHANSSKKRKEYRGLYVKYKKTGSINVWRCHVSESYNINFFGRLWGYFSFVFSSLFCCLFKVKGKFDVVVVTSPPLFVAITGYIISKLKKIILVFEVRDLWPESAIDTHVLKNKLLIKLAFKFEKFIYRSATLINVLTPAFRDVLVFKKNVPLKKIIMIPNGADFALAEETYENFNRDDFRKQHNLDGFFVIVYVGAHGVANDLQQLIVAAENLLDTNVLFLLIGEGMEKQKLKNIVSIRNISNVKLLNAVPKNEIFKYIIASEMGVSVLKPNDTFKTVYSNKTFDYMSCKKPILMAIDGVSRQLIEEAKAGTFIVPGNIECFNLVIRQYLENPSRLQVEGESGYKYVKNNFDRTSLAKIYLNHITNLLK